MWSPARSYGVSMPIGIIPMLRPLTYSAHRAPSPVFQCLSALSLCCDESIPHPSRRQRRFQCLSALSLCCDLDQEQVERGLDRMFQCLSALSLCCDVVANTARIAAELRFQCLSALSLCCDDREGGATLLSLAVSMPIGIIPVLRPTREVVSTDRLGGFNAYRHYPCVATRREAARRIMQQGSFNAYRHYPCVATVYGLHRSRPALLVSMPIGIIPVLRRQ